MKKNFVILLEWNVILISYFFTPFLLGCLAVSLVEWQVNDGILRPLFEEPFHLKPWGRVVGAVALMLPYWNKVARKDRYKGHISLAALSLATIAYAGAINHNFTLQERYGLYLALGISFSYLIRFVTLMQDALNEKGN